MSDLTDTVNNPDCMGCLSSGDIGLGGSDVAYAHPLCPAHGIPLHHFVLGEPDTFGRLMCGHCQAYQTEHLDQLTRSLVDLEVQREMSGGYTDNATRIMNDYRAKVAAQAVGGGVR